MRRFPRAVHALLSLGVFFWTLSPFSPLLADDYQGAKAIVKKLAGGKSPVAADQVPEEVKKPNTDIDDFSKKVATLSPADAARRWVELLDLAVQSKGQASGDGSTGKPELGEVLAALPPPASWDEIAKVVEARPAPTAATPPPASPSLWGAIGKFFGTDSGPKAGGKTLYENELRLIAHTLAGNREAQEKDAETMETLLKGNSEEGDYEGTRVSGEIAQAVIAGTDDPEAIRKSLDEELAALKATQPTLLAYRTFVLPDVVTIFGKEKAGEFLRHVLQESPVALEARKGRETRDLARDIALEEVAGLKAPQWGLACSLEGGPLFEALTKRFPHRDTSTNGYDASRWQEARSYYLFGLIAHQQTTQAVALAKEMGANAETIPYGVIEQLEQAGYLNAVYDFFYELLTDNPGLPFWNELIQVSAKTGNTGKLLELARKSMARTDLPDKQRMIVGNELYKVLLANGQVDEGVKELQKIVESGPPVVAPENGYSSDTNNNYPALKLARIGMLMENKEWIEEGIDAARKEVSTENGKNEQTATLGLAELLAELGRGPEAESVLADALAKLPPDNEQQSNELTYTSSGKLMLALLRLYDNAGRHDDVLTLLDQAPNWGVRDLAAFYTEDIEPEIVTEFYSHAARADTNAGYIAASALAAAGRNDEAEKIVNAVLDVKGGFDPAYELLLKLEGQKAIPRLDELFSRDQFECRPLIWKASLLKDAGKLEEAEKCIRQAISVDPSDGEQGPGRRMRAYAVLADIREARGDAEQARFFREVVNAIRLSEKADRFYEAGMLSRAVAMYEDALTHFSNAYCIQSRLALRLSEMGQNEAAEEHYRKAYELMPESFGRVESHCFGCERAFAGGRAQSIAEKVFTGLAEKMPDKPQVHYLLGYLRFEEDRYKEALPHFQTAVKLDPEYLNAWKKIQSIGEELRLPLADRDAVTFNILRLDPLGHHSSNDFREVSDLRTLWKTVADSAGKRPPKPGSLYPLAASSAVMAKTAPLPENWVSRSYYDPESENDLTPAKAVWRNGFLKAAGSLLENHGQLN